MQKNAKSDDQEQCYQGTAAGAKAVCGPDVRPGNPETASLGQEGPEARFPDPLAEWGARERLFEWLWRQSLAGVFLMTLDPPVQWPPAGDRQETLEYIFRNLRITRVNDALLTQYGARASDLLGQSPADLFAHDPAAGLALWGRLLDTGQLPAETDQRRLDGSFLRLEADYLSLRDSAGCVFGHFGIQRDMAGQRAEEARRRTEEALRASEERYRELFDNANDILYTINLEGVFTSVNQAAERVTGYPHDELLGKKFAVIVAPEYLNCAREMIARKLAGEGDTIYELEIIARDGRRIPLELSTRLIRSQGVAVGVQGIARDVTERKSLEEQLRQAQKMEAVGRLAGGVAHDFNNLLAVILGYSALLQERPDLGLSVQESVEEIHRAAEKGVSLTRQLLTFSHRRVLEPRVFDLNAALLEVEEMLRRLIGEDIELVIQPHATQSRLKADPGQVEQVILNLAVNSRDAMPQGGRLTIQTANVELNSACARAHGAVPPGSYVLLTITDTGHGMDSATLARIFEPFFTTKEPGRGTGLGLAIVYGIVEGSGGHITVSSEPDQGAVFKIYLPRVTEDPDTGPESHRTADRPRAGTETILVVEDDEALRKLTREFLESLGYLVLAAGDGAEALRLAARLTEPVHLLISDVVMPGLSGRGLADRLATLHPETRVLYFSGYTGNAISDHGIPDAGVVLPKPFTLKSLARKVREILDAP